MFDESWRYFFNNKLTLKYITAEDAFSHDILGDKFHKKVNFPHPLKNIFEEPFFCTDHRYTFFVELIQSADNTA